MFENLKNLFNKKPKTSMTVSDGLKMLLPVFDREAWEAIPDDGNFLIDFPDYSYDTDEAVEMSNGLIKPQVYELHKVLNSVVQSYQGFSFGMYANFLQNQDDREIVRAMYILERVKKSVKAVEPREKPRSTHDSAYGALVRKIATSHGVADACTILGKQLGVEIRTVEDKENAWNIVKVGKDWYTMDATKDHFLKKGKGGLKQCDKDLPIEKVDKVRSVLDEHMLAFEYNPGRLSGQTKVNVAGMKRADLGERQK